VDPDGGVYSAVQDISNCWSTSWPVVAGSAEKNAKGHWLVDQGRKDYKDKIEQTKTEIYISCSYDLENMSHILQNMEKYGEIWLIL